MLDRILGGLFGCGEKRDPCHSTNSSCDVMWIIILLMILFNGGLFGIDICTLVILLIVFGGQLFGKKKEHKCC